MRDEVIERDLSSLRDGLKLAIANGAKDRIVNIEPALSAVLVLGTIATKIGKNDFRSALCRLGDVREFLFVIATDAQVQLVSDQGRQPRGGRVGIGTLATTAIIELANGKLQSAYDLVMEAMASLQDMLVQRGKPLPRIPVPGESASPYADRLKRLRSGFRGRRTV